MAENVAAEQLRLFIERIETLMEEGRGIADDIKDVFAEAKGTGFDTRTMRAVIKMRAKDKSTLQEENALLETYCSALGLEAPAIGGEPAEDPRLRAIEAEVLKTLRATGRANIVRLKAALKDKDAKALDYGGLTARLGALIDRGEARTHPGRTADFPEYEAV